MKGNVLVYYKTLSQHSSRGNEKNKTKTYLAPAVSGRNSNPTPPSARDRVRSVRSHTVESDGVLEKAPMAYIMVLPRNLSGGNAECDKNTARPGFEPAISPLRVKCVTALSRIHVMS